MTYWHRSQENSSEYHKKKKTVILLLKSGLIPQVLFGTKENTTLGSDFQVYRPWLRARNNGRSYQREHA